MAKDSKNTEKTLDDLAAKSSTLIYGIPDSLEDESRQVQDIIVQTIRDTSSKLGVKTNGNVVGYFDEINISGIFNTIMKDRGGKEGNGKKTPTDFKEFMEKQNVSGINEILTSNADKLLTYNNYRQIYKHIPECAQALDTYRDNIMSPDDFTKMIFNVFYDGEPSDKTKIDIDKRLELLLKKYRIADKADKIIGETLLLGEQYVAVLSINDDLGRMMSDPVYLKNGNQQFATLNEETYRALDETYYSRDIEDSDILLNEDDRSFLNEYFNLTEGDTEGGISLEDKIAKIVNENVIIGSKYELFEDHVEAESQSLLEDEFKKRLENDGKKPDDKDKKDNKTLGLNGSSIKILDVERVVDLRIDDICYGYYYATETTSSINNVGTMNPNSGRELKQSISIASNNTLTGVNTVDYTTNNTVSRELNVDEAKLNLISNIFINAIAKKINKSFIRRNKDFKTLIYSLIKQDYIIKKGVKLIYFLPEEVVKFEAPALYRKIVFFAKLYLATLTNTLLIKLGRAHDKRLFYVNVGLDANYEQAISRVIQDIKTKEYKMDNLSDINTILNLNPGRFDDYFIPSINGDRPIDIETMPGMDTEMTNEFMEFLKNSMMSGIGIPRDLIDSMNTLDFARTLSAQNANFVRSVIRYQLALTDSFTDLMRKIYRNEYKYVGNVLNDATKLENDCNNIFAKFPSPASLNFTNMSDAMQGADSNAEFIAMQLIPPKQDGSTEDARAELKAEILKDMLPGVDWDKYTEIKEKIALKMKLEEIVPPPPPGEEGMDPGMY